MYAFSVWDPWVLRIRHVFLCGFPFSSLNVTASSNLQKKKGHVSLQNILPAQKRKKKRKREWARGRQSVSTPAENAYHAQHRALPCNKPQRQGEPITTSPQIFVSLAQYLNKYKIHQVCHLARVCTSDLYQHLKPLLNSWHQKVIHEVASCILFETRCKYDTPPKLSTSTWFISNHPFLKGHRFKD